MFPVWRNRCGRRPSRKFLPTRSARKKELLFTDDFERAELGTKWKEVVPTFTLEKGTLKGTQTRITTPATDGKPAVVGHQAVIGTDVPTKDSVIELRSSQARGSNVAVGRV